MGDSPARMASGELPAARSRHCRTRNHDPAQAVAVAKVTIAKFQSVSRRRIGRGVMRCFPSLVPPAGLHQYSRRWDASNHERPLKSWMGRLCFLYQLHRVVILGGLKRLYLQQAHDSLSDSVPVRSVSEKVMSRLAFFPCAATLGKKRPRCNYVVNRAENGTRFPHESYLWLACFDRAEIVITLWRSQATGRNVALTDDELF